MMVNFAGRILAVIAILSLFTAVPSLADSIAITTSFNVTASPLDIYEMGIDLFDSSLGTLTNVRVTIQGSLTLVVDNTPYTDGWGNPIAYDYNIGVYQLFYGVLPSIFFNFEDPGGTFIIAGQSSGAGDTFGYSTSFSYDFEFNSITDMAGGTVPTTTNVIPPPFVDGLLANFIQDIIPLNEIDLRQWNEYLGGIGPVPALITSYADGFLTIRYDYTPVPLPSTLVLLGSGLMGLAGWRRFRKG